MKYVALSQGQRAIVDDEMFDEISKFNWTFQKAKKDDGYAFRRPTVNGKRVLILMHREIMKPGDGLEVDHINRNKLDNRKENLRICSTEENLRNRGTQKNNKSGYRGVSWNRNAKKWHAQISIGHRRTHLGYFPDKFEAIGVYNQMAVRYYGPFAGVIKS